MKIGIVTFYAVANYGAMLQAYGLKAVLESWGHDVCFLPFSFAKQDKFSLKKLFFSRSFSTLKKKIQFNSDISNLVIPFVHHLPELPKRDFDVLKTTGKGVDALIVGSDQMWNPAWFLSKLAEVFLQFSDENTKRISYAVSLCVDVWPEAFRSVTRQYLHSFSAVSVREKSAIRVIEDISGVSPSWVLDPTLLVGAEAFKKLLASSSLPVCAPYVFAYFLRKNTSAIDAAIACVQEKQKLHLVLNQVALKSYLYDRKIPVVEWIARIKNASFVLTDSFHGTVFAILFHRPFLAFALSGSNVDTGMNERLYSLLEGLELKNRLVEKNRALNECCFEPIDWEHVDALLTLQRKESEHFLLQALGE